MNDAHSSARFNRRKVTTASVSIDGLKIEWFEDLSIIGVPIETVTLNFKKNSFEHEELEALCARYLTERGYTVSEPPTRVKPNTEHLRALSAEERYDAMREVREALG